MEHIVQHALHHIPITDNTGTGIEGVAELTASGGIDVGIVSDKVALTTQFAIAVTAHNRREDETGALVKGPTSLDEIGT